MFELELRQLAAIAAKEFQDRLRNRWVLAVAAVFAACSLAIAYFGPAVQGQIGPRSIELVVASLVSLVTYLVPLIALLLGFDAVVGERERGSLPLLLSLPLTRLELLLGKFLRLAAVLVFSTLAGFAPALALLGQQFGATGLQMLGVFVASAVLLGLAFLSLALLLSVVARDRAQASGFAIALWFALVLVFDLVLLGLLVASGGEVGGEAFALLLLLNPADIFRLLNVFWLQDIRRIYGLATLVPPAMAQPAILGGAIAAWIAAPLAIAVWRFKP